jgi:phospholipid/cholesterol/gamma-HCH transport system substrate-binding protein
VLWAECRGTARGFYLTDRSSDILNATSRDERLMRYLSVAGFLLAVGALLIFLLRFFTQMGESRESYTVKAFFEHTGGINKGNPIKMVGYSIGSVASIDLDMERRGVNMLLNINAGVQIPKNSLLKVAEKGMLGEMYLYFTFGDAKEFLQPFEEVKGTPPVGLSDLMSTAGETIEGAGTEFTAVLQKLNELLGTPGFSKNIAATVAEAPGLLNNLSGLVTEVRPILTDVLKNLQGVTTSLSSTMNILDEQLKAVAERKTLEKLDGAVENMGALMGRVDAMIKNDIDPAMDELTSMMKSLHATVNEVHGVAQALEPVVSGLGPDSEGSLAQMIHGGALSSQIGDFLNAGTDLLILLEEQPNSIIFGKRKRKNENEKIERSRRPVEEFNTTEIKVED